jgi:hypothetical protein
MGTIVGVIVTFPAVVLAWVFFRSPNLHTALDIISSMVGLNGITLPGRSLFKWGLADEIEKLGIHFGASTLFYGNESIWTWIAILWIIAWYSPNSQQILSSYQPTLDKVIFIGRINWVPNAIIAWLVGSIFVITLFSIGKISTFLYFQF